MEEYWQLFVLRALTGIALGGALPLVFSMISDLYPASERAKASSFVGLATGAGIGFGQLLASVLGSTHGWRAPFVAGRIFSRVSFSLKSAVKINCCGTDSQ